MSESCVWHCRKGMTKKGTQNKYQSNPGRDEKGITDKPAEGNDKMIWGKEGIIGRGASRNQAEPKSKGKKERKKLATRGSRRGGRKE